MTLATGPLAMTGAWSDPERGLLSLIVLEIGGSSDICAGLKPGDPVAGLPRPPLFSCFRRDQAMD